MRMLEGEKMEMRTGNVEVHNSPPDSETTEEQVSGFGAMSIGGYSISDSTTFKYCLGSLTDRTIILKEVAASVSQDQLSRFADEVSLYSGCSHHRHQILIAKSLIEEGTNVWNLLAQNKLLIQWENLVLVIEEQFMQISGGSTRSLTRQDFEVLKRIAGCRDYMAQENFEKMWCWLYPIAFTLSREWINGLWNSVSPKWIEGFITKEEAEFSLQGPKGLQEPGTFLLRFPTSRSWPHPDAGSLIVSYVGSDYTIHHRLLSFDYIYSCKDKKNVKTLQELLLAEPELSRLGRTEQKELQGRHGKLLNSLLMSMSLFISIGPVCQGKCEDIPDCAPELVTLKAIATLHSISTVAADDKTNL